MPLRSQAFAGDPKLEACAVSHSAHITRGHKGKHVAKIQAALNALDGAGLAVDEVYGPATAAAVLAFKQKRKIINSSYQSQADDTVGKMTIVRLDDELADLKPAPGPRKDLEFHLDYCKFFDRNAFFHRRDRR
ncbi:peptidoglycan-binding protein [uncultured Alsobacter sp.]|uniref:peptidoglycan-binding domain-containing protein n=1 Tax=uncultured Alsobacter sp. TaxID=1748258 RepID=UPI0025EE7FE5|nr:peptidoglycan-binding protein [uncultured Alsobacter sp.]